MHTGVLDMLGDGMDEELAVRCNSININLLSTLHKLRDDDWVVWADIGGSRELLLQLILRPDDSHSSAGEDVARTDKHRVAHFIGESLGLVDRGQLPPCRLVNANRVQDLRELVTVFGLVNVLWVRTEHLGLTSVLELESDVLR